MPNNLTIGELMELVFTEYKLNGYCDMWQPQIKNESSKIQQFRDLSEIGLIHTEISEAQEEIRKLTYEKNLYEDFNPLLKELADTVIRIFNFCSRKNLDLESAIISKHSQNLGRGKLHGKSI